MNNNRFIHPLIVLAFILLIFGLSFKEAQAAAEPVYKGQASWYGTTAHGKKTANGETFLKNKFSAAHKTLPFGTVLRVHNPSQDKDVLVRVNDRGPFIKNRVIDLSKRAADNLNMIQDGVASVEFEAVTDHEGRPLNPKNAFFVRLEEAINAQQAHSLSADIQEALGQKVSLVRDKNSGSISLCIGPFYTFQDAEKSVRNLDRKYAVMDIIEGPGGGGKLSFFSSYPEPGQNLVESSISALNSFSTLDLTN